MELLDLRRGGGWGRAIWSAFGASWRRGPRYGELLKGSVPGVAGLGFDDRGLTRGGSFLGLYRKPRRSRFRPDGGSERRRHTARSDGFSERRFLRRDR